MKQSDYSWYRRVGAEYKYPALLDQISLQINILTSMRELGVRVALDDFGSGFSSFLYLKNLDVDYIKIDGLFVKDMAEDPMDYAMVKSINEVVQMLGKETIAEFVEDDLILDKLRTLGVNYGQGFGMAMPRPLKEIFS